MGRDTIQLENVVSTISQEYLLEFTSEYGIPESLHPELLGPEDPIVEFPEVIGAAKSTLGGKSLASMGIRTGTTASTPATQKIPVHAEGVSGPDPLSYAKPRPVPEQDVAQSSMGHRAWSTLSAMGMSEGLKHGVEHGRAKVDLAAIEAYDLEADTKYVAAFHVLKDLKYPLVDQLEKLKDAPIDLKIPVYPEVRNLKDPWSFKDEILLEDAIAANVSRIEKKKKYRVVCRTHRVGSTHHARSDGIPVSVPIVAPQGLTILLADAATQTHITEDEASPRLIRSKSLPPLYNLDWP
nr:hypothetical protein [Tanacetum cinerariifolium]